MPLLEQPITESGRSCDLQDKEKRAAADKAAADEAADRDLALKLQQQEEVAPPTPSAWHTPTSGAM